MLWLTDEKFKITIKNILKTTGKIYEMHEEKRNSETYGKLKKKEPNVNYRNENYNMWNKSNSFKEIKSRMDTAEKKD